MSVDQAADAAASASLPASCDDDALPVGAAVSSELCFSSAVNWYSCSSVSWSGSSDSGHVLALATQDSIVLSSITDRRHLLLLPSHPARICAVSFCNVDPLQHLLACSCADRSLRIWDTRSSTPSSSRLFCMLSNAHRSDPTALATSSSIPDLVVSADKQGFIVSYRFGDTSSSDSTHRTRLGDVAITVIVSSKPKASVPCFVAGLANGALVIIDEHARTTLRRLPAHTGAIQCISFDTPISGVFASSSKDRSVRVYNMIRSSDDQVKTSLLKTIAAPIPSGRPISDQQKQRLFIALSFLPDRTGHLFLSSYAGTLWRCRVLPPLSSSSDSWRSSSFSSRPVRVLPVSGTSQSAHSRPVFSITFNAAFPDMFVSTSMDRLTLLWKLENVASSAVSQREVGGGGGDGDDETNSKTCSARILWSMPGNGGFVYGLCASKLEPGLFVIGLGDRTIRAWKRSSPPSSSDRCWMLWKALQSKVTCVSFHPERRGYIAYGCDDGTVGTYDVHQHKAGVRRSLHRSTVYKVQWARSRHDHQAFSICSIAADGRFLQAHHNDDQHVIDIGKAAIEALKRHSGITLRSKITEFAIEELDDDGGVGSSIVAIGCSDGSVLLWLETDDKTHLFEQQRSLINRLCFSSSLEVASASTDGSVAVYPHSIESSSSSNEARLLLKHHHGAVLSVAFNRTSSHHAHLLASGSADSSVQIWDVRTGEPLYNLRGPSGRVLCLEWDSSQMPSDHVVGIVAGSDDQTLFSWRINTQQTPEHRLPPEPSPSAASKKQKSRNRKKKATTSTTSTPAPASSAPEAASSSSLCPTWLSSASFRRRTPSQDRIACLDQVRSSCSSSSADLEDASLRSREHVLRYISGDDIMDDSVSLLWRGSLPLALQRQLDSTCAITPIWAALSALCGTHTYKTCLLSLAHALDRGHPSSIHESVAIYIALSEPAKGVRVYLNHHEYASALALARLRCSSDSALIRECLSGWARHQSGDSPELTARIYAALGDESRAINALASSSIASALELAQHYADQASSPSSSSNARVSKLALEYALVCQAQCEWKDASKALLKVDQDTRFVYDVMLCLDHLLVQHHSASSLDLYLSARRMVDIMAPQRLHEVVLSMGEHVWINVFREAAHESDASGDHHRCCDVRVRAARSLCLSIIDSDRYVPALVELLVEEELLDELISLFVIDMKASHDFTRIFSSCSRFIVRLAKLASIGTFDVHAWSTHVHAEEMVFEDRSNAEDLRRNLVLFEEGSIDRQTLLESCRSIQALIMPKDKAAE